MPRVRSSAALAIMIPCALAPAMAQNAVTIPYSLDTPENRQYLDAAAAGGTATLRIRAAVTDGHGKTVWACGDHNTTVAIAPDTAWFAAYQTEWIRYSGNMSPSDLNGPSGSGPFDSVDFFLTPEPFGSGCGPTGVATMSGLPALKYLVIVQPPRAAVGPNGGVLVAHVALRDNQATEISLGDKHMGFHAQTLEIFDP
jgi:hypothetical protein